MSVVALTGMPALSTLMPIFADSLSASTHGAAALGILMGASGMGALVGALYLASRKSVVGLGRVIAIACAILGGALVAFSFSRHLWLSLLIVPITGFGMITNFASANTVLQTLADDEKRGRVMSFFTMAFIGMTPFGNLLCGSLASALGGGVDGAARTVLIMGSICLVASIIFATRLPGLRAIVRPIYIEKGIITQVAEGLGATARLSEATSEP